jgi:D-3-phosphoglycerate dehydrogenase
VPLRVLVTDHVFAGLETERRVLAEVGAAVEMAPAVDAASLADADALLVCYARVDASLIEALPRCRVISRYGIGYDNVDVEAATRRGIVVTNVPDYCVDEVSDHTLALLLTWARRICALDARVKGGAWDFAPLRPLHRLRGQTLGIVGYGRIGRLVASKASAFGLRLLAHDPFAPVGPPAEPATLERLLEESDFVSLHLPLSAATRGLMGRQQLARMKRGAVLINTSRGGLVDEQALYEALAGGHLGGAALDVLADERAAQASPLARLPNVVLTPHVAFYSEESEAELQRKAAENVAAVLAGRRPAYVVNPQVYGATA